MKKTLSKLVETVKTNKRTCIGATLCVLVLLVSLAACCNNIKTEAPAADPTSTPSTVASTTEDTGQGTTTATTTVPVASSTKVEEQATTSSATTTPSTTAKEEVTPDTTTAAPTTVQTTKTTISTNKTTIQTSKATTGTKKGTTTTTKSTTATKPGAWVIIDTSSQDDDKDVIDPLTGKPCYVVKTEAYTNSSGLKVERVYYSDGTTTATVECEHCHKMPCPNGGGEKCSQYSAKEDPTKTCSNCGRPRGDGYNGTCHGTVDWDKGGTLICNHYD